MTTRNGRREKRMMTRQRAVSIAARIARMVFTRGGDHAHGKHLRMFDDTHDEARYMCGWSEEPMAQRIAELLARVRVRPAKGGGRKR